MISYINLSVLLCCLGAGLHFKQLLTGHLISLIWLVSLSIILKLTSLYWEWIFNEPASIVDGIYQVFEYYFLAWFVLTLIQGSKPGMAIRISISSIVIINFINIFFMQERNNSPNYIFLLTSLLLVIWSLVYFHQIFKSADFTIMIKSPNIWICAGILFYYAGKLLLIGVTKALGASSFDLATKLYFIINHQLNCILYGMITYGFICQAKNQNS